MNLSHRYSGLSAINHWIAVLFVIAMLVLGLVATEAPTDIAEDYILDVHISLGFFAFLFIFWRVAFRLYQGFPPPLEDSAMERWAAYLVHRLLLVVLTLQILTGPLYLFTEGEAVNVFGWFSVQLPLGSLEAIHEPMEDIHKIVGTYIIPLLLLFHIAGAIRYYFRRNAAPD